MQLIVVEVVHTMTFGSVSFLNKYLCIEQLFSGAAKIVGKSLHDLAPPYLCDLSTCNSISSSYALRSMATDLKLPKKKSCNGQKCFFYRGAEMWNNLSEKTTQASSLY